MYYVCNPTTSATQTITVSGNYPGSIFAAYRGTRSTLCADHGAGYSPGQVASVQAGSITPSGNGYLIVAGLGANAASTAMTINQGFSISACLIDVSGGVGECQAFLLQATQAPVNPTWTWSSSEWAEAVIESFVPVVTNRGLGLVF
jgi:hypothetical protein